MAKMKIRFYKPTIHRNDLKSVLETLVMDNLEQNFLTGEFEKKTAEYIGVKHSIALNNGSIALILSLKALGIKKHDSVIFSSFSPVSYLNAVLYLGAKPIIVDTGNNSFMISIKDAIEIAEKQEIKCFIISYPFGITEDISPLLDTNIPVIEDITFSFGSLINGRMTGTLGKIAFTSLDSSAMFTAGQGGIVFSNNKNYINFIKEYRDFSNDKYFPHLEVKFSDYNAALGLSQLKEYQDIAKRRKELTKIFNEAIMRSSVRLVRENLNKDWVNFMYPIQLPFNAEKGIKFFKRYDIEAKKPLPRLIHHFLNKNWEDFQNSEKIYRTVISPPFYPVLRTDEIKFILEKILSIQRDI